MKSWFFGPALRVSLGYVLLAGLWILFSDRLAEELATNRDQLTYLQNYKGWAFVAATGYALYVLLVWRGQAEERVRYLATMLENVNDAIVASDAQYRITAWNAAAESLYGWKAQEVLGQNGLKITRTEWPAVDADEMRREIAEAVRWRGEASQIRKDGTRFPVELSSLVLHDSAGRITGYLSVIRDITERRQAQARIERQVHRLSALRTVDMAISSSFDLRLSLDILLAQAINELQMDAAAVLVLNEVSNELEYAAGSGFRGAGIGGLRLKAGEGYAGQAALERRTVSVHNLAAVIDTFSSPRLIVDENFVAFFAVPLIAKGKVKGVMEVFHRSRFDPEPEWLDFLETLAGQAAIAIDSAQTFSELQHSNIELSLAYDATIEGWSRAMDLRDRETEGHTQRVTEMAVNLGRAMGLPEQELTHMRRGALLHDIGKMGVPDAILLKPGPLSEEEWAAMRQHPTLAYEMLSKVRHLEPAINIPYCHHEKWDGSGYPRGLKAEQSPLPARIFAVIDVYDALTSDRSYRAAWSAEKAREYIREQAGIQFDPQIVELFLGEAPGAR